MESASTKASTSTHRVEDNVEESMLPTSSGPPRVLEEKSALKDGELIDHGWLSDVIIAPSKPAPTGEIQPLNSGMEAIHEVLLAESSSLEWATQGSDELQQWLTGCVETYFDGFHLRWPILNAPSFDATTSSLYLAAAVCVIGVWLRKCQEQEEKRSALRVHEALLQLLLHKLVGIQISVEIGLLTFRRLSLSRCSMDNHGQSNCSRRLY